MKHLIFSLFLFLAGCSLVFTKPTVTFRELKMVDLNSRGMTLNLLLNVKNPNSYDITLDGYQYSVSILDLPLARGDNKEDINFPGKTATDIQVPLRIAYADLLDILLKCPNPTNVPYQLAAGLDIATPVGTLNVPVATSGTIAVPKDKLKTQLLKSIGERFGIK